MSLSFHRDVRPLCKNDLAVDPVFIVIDYSKIVKSMRSERAFLGSSLHRSGGAFRLIASQKEIDYNNQVLPLSAVDSSAFSLSRLTILSTRVEYNPRSNTMKEEDLL